MGGEGAQSGARSSGDLEGGWGHSKALESARGSNPFPWEPRVSGMTEMPLKLWMGHCPELSGLPPETLNVSGESGFSVGVRRKGGEAEIDWAPRVTAGSVVTDGNLEKCAGYISLSFSKLNVCPGPGTQPDLPAEVCLELFLRNGRGQRGGGDCGVRGSRGEKEWGLQIETFPPIH